MKDKWMNIGFEEDELKPYIEPPPDFNDPLRIGKIILLILVEHSTLICCRSYFKARAKLKTNI